MVKEQDRRKEREEGFNPAKGPTKTQVKRVLKQINANPNTKGIKIFEILYIFYYNNTFSRHVK